MSSKLDGICKSIEVDSQGVMTTFEFHVKNLQLINSFLKSKWLFQINKKNWTFHVLDGIPSRNFVNPTMR